MSDDSIGIVAKLDDKKDYSLTPFIEYFVNHGFHISAYQFKKEELLQSLQAKLTVDSNFRLQRVLKQIFYLISFITTKLGAIKTM